MDTSPASVDRQSVWEKATSPERRSMWEEAVEDNRDPYVAWSGMAAAKLKADDPAGTSEAAKTAIGLQPRTGYAYALHALALAETDQATDALAAVKEGLLLSDDAEGRWFLARLLFRLSGAEDVPYASVLDVASELRERGDVRGWLGYPLAAAGHLLRGEVQPAQEMCQAGRAVPNYQALLPGANLTTVLALLRLRRGDQDPFGPFRDQYGQRTMLWPPAWLILAVDTSKHARWEEALLFAEAYHAASSSDRKLTYHDAPIFPAEDPLWSQLAQEGRAGDSLRELLVLGLARDGLGDAQAASRAFEEAAAADPSHPLASAAARGYRGRELIAVNQGEVMEAMTCALSSQQHAVGGGPGD